MNIKPLLEDSINLFHYLQLLCLLYDHCVRACVCVCVCVCGICVSVSLITGYPLVRKYASWYCQGLSKTWATLCVVCVCMDVDLQLGRQNNYKCIWNPTALMLSVIAFSSKLQESAWNRVFSFVLWRNVVTALEKLQQSSRKLPVEITDLRVCVCAFVRAGVRFDCTWRGWCGCTVVSTVASQEFACFSQIPQTSTLGGLDTECLVTYGISECSLRAVMHS